MGLWTGSIRGNIHGGGKTKSLCRTHGNFHPGECEKDSTERRETSSFSRLCQPGEIRHDFLHHPRRLPAREQCGRES
jgi:hypothetical protein